MVPMSRPKKPSLFIQRLWTGWRLVVSSTFLSPRSTTRTIQSYSFFVLNDWRKLIQLSQDWTSLSVKSSLLSSRLMIIHMKPCRVLRDTCCAIVVSKRSALSLWICTRISYPFTISNLSRRSLMPIWTSTCGMRLTREVSSPTGSSHQT